MAVRITKHTTTRLGILVTMPASMYFVKIGMKNTLPRINRNAAIAEKNCNGL